MSQSKTTKEERMLIAIAKAAKNNTSSPIDVEPIAKTLGYSEKQAQKAINLLARGNFLWKRGDWLVEIAPHGLRTVESEL